MDDPTGTIGEAGRKSRIELLDALVRKAYEHVSRRLDGTSDTKAVDDLVKLVKLEKDMPAEPTDSEAFAIQWVSDDGETESD